MPVKFGVIGCGAIGQRRHIPEIVANSNAKIVALSDPQEERVTELAKKYNALGFTDYHKMLAEADLDAVVVCGPNSLHAPMTVDSFKAGKHVLVEKPMACTREEAKAMIAAGKKAGKYLMVGQNQRLARMHQKTKEILETGRMGKVLSFRTSFKHAGPDFWSVDGSKSWFFQAKAAVMGATGDLGIHKVDLMRWLLGEEFTEVSAIVTTIDKRTPDGKLIPLDDNALLLLKSKNGTIGTVEVSWTGYGGEDNATVIFCQKGAIKVNADREYGVIVDIRKGDKEFYKVGAMATNDKQNSSGVVDAFIESIISKKAPEINGEEGYRSLNVILTAMEASKAGKTLKIKY